MHRQSTGRKNNRKEGRKDENKTRQGRLTLYNRNKYYDGQLKETAS